MIVPGYDSVDREAIWAALFAHFQGVLASSYAVMGRKHKSPPDLTVAEQPAFFQVAARERRNPKSVMGTPNLVELCGFLIIYVYDDSPSEIVGEELLLPETQLNNRLKEIDDALRPDDFATGKFTIGGLVTHCWIEEDTDLDPAILGPQAAAILKLHILV